MTRNDIRQIVREIIEARIYGGGEHGISISTEYELTPEEQASLKNMTPKERQKFASTKMKQLRRSRQQCISCGQPAASKPDGTPGSYCKKHLESFRVARQKLVKQRGSCSRCMNPPMPGKKLCKKCTDDLELVRLKALANGLCIRCKKKPIEPNEKGEQTLHCRDCMKAKVDWNRRRKNFKKSWQDYAKDIESADLANRNTKNKKPWNKTMTGF